MLKEVLFVLANYFPVGGAGANIVSRLAGELYKNGMDVSVLTTKSEIGQPDFSEEQGIKVYRKSFYANFSFRQTKSLYLKSKIFISKAKNKISRSQKKNFISKPLRNCFYRALKEINAKQYDVIIPVCAYYEMYEAVKKYKDKYKISSSVIVYQLDPLSTNGNMSPKSYPARFKFENTIAGENAVITTAILKSQKEQQGINTGNVTVADFPSILDKTQNNIKNVQDQEIRAVFSGFLYEKIRNPEYALKLFSSLPSNIKLYIIGSGSESLVSRYANDYPDKIESIGILPIDEAQKWIDEADVLMNIGNSDINFVPSKIFDYISTGKPIINIYKDKDCPTLKYFSKYDNVVSIYEKDEITNSVEKTENFLQNNLGKVVPFEIIRQNFHENTLDCVTERFIEVINKE